MDASIKQDPDGISASNLPLVWSQASLPISAPHAHMATIAQQQHVAPPPAHAHQSTTNQKPPDSFLDKGLLEAAAFLDSKNIGLPLKTGPESSSGNDSGLPWAGLPSSLLQQYGQYMLDRMMNKQSEGGTTPSATATTDIGEEAISLTSQSVTGVLDATTNALAHAHTHTHKPQEIDADHNSIHRDPTTIPRDPNTGQRDPNSLQAQRDVYRRMLNYTMSSALTQQYYMSQYGYNYMQDRLSKPDTSATMGNHTTTSSAPAPLPSVQSVTQTRAQLPSIDSVLLNLSTKKTNQTTSPTSASRSMPHMSNMSEPVPSQSVPAYGLQALANAAIEADPKAFSEADTDRKDGQKSELDDVTDTDDSNMSPSDSGTSQIMSPPRNTYSHLLDPNLHHVSIPAAHSHQYQSLYQHKPMGTLPGIQHFSTMSKPVTKHQPEQNLHQQLPLSSGIKPSDLVAAAMKLKVEPTEEKEIADRTIQEQIAAHQLNAVQQQVHDLTASALAAAGNIDAAALLAKLPLNPNLESDLQRHIERAYDYDTEGMHPLQQEPMELTSDMSPGKASSRRKSRGRPTSIESLRDPLGRQSSTSSLGANTSISGEADDRTYDCEICGKQFSHNDRLRRHRKIHTTEKPYKCDICGKGFKEKCNLKHHRFIHTGEKPYRCDTCGKSFNQRSSLKTHQKVHTGEKPFKCELCEKPFAQKYLLRQHMKKHIEVNMPPQQ